MKFLIVAFLCVIPQAQLIYGRTDDAINNPALQTCQDNVKTAKARIDALTSWDSTLPGDIVNNLNNFIFPISYELESTINSGYMNLMSKYSTDMNIYNTLNKYQQFFQSDITEIKNSQIMLLQQKLERIGNVFQNDIKVVKEKLSAINEEVDDDCSEYNILFDDMRSSHTDLLTKLNNANNQEEVTNILDQPNTQRFHIADFTVDFSIQSIFYNMNSEQTPLQNHINGWNQLEDKFKGNINEILKVLDSTAATTTASIKQRSELTAAQRTKLENKVHGKIDRSQCSLNNQVQEFVDAKNESIDEFKTALNTNSDAASDAYQPTNMIDSKAAYALYGIFANNDANISLDILRAI